MQSDHAFGSLKYSPACQSNNSSLRRQETGFLDFEITLIQAVPQCLEGLLLLEVSQ